MPAGSLFSGLVCRTALSPWNNLLVLIFCKEMCYCASVPEELIKELISRRLKLLLESVSVSYDRVTNIHRLNCLKHACYLVVSVGPESGCDLAGSCAGVSCGSS